MMILKNLFDCFVLNLKSQPQEITSVILKPLPFTALKIKHFAVHLLALLINYICDI